mmetsp:Transcript_873/g.1437  ORF Transcript_873/g.1437 Transcript_873/m.1437 type:complete len:315 (-) Transcript_873:36-980(-)
MNLMLSDRMSIEVANALDGIRLTIQLHLKTLHDFLNGFANIAQTHIDTCRLDALIRRFLDGLQQGIVLGVERYSPRRINDAPINLCSKVHLHDIIIAQHGIITRIGSIMRRDVIETATGRKANTTVQTSLHDELTVLILQSFAHVRELNAGLDERMSVRTHLSMDFGGVANLGVQVFRDAFHISQLFRVLPVRLRLQGMRLDLTYGEGFTRKESGDRNGGWFRLTVLDVIIGKARVLESQRWWSKSRFLDFAYGSSPALFLFAIALLLALLLFRSSLSFASFFAFFVVIILDILTIILVIDLLLLLYFVHCHDC